MAPKDQVPTNPISARGPDVVAAGAVVFRKDNGGEVLLVHRPKYDDWAWPKGKQDPGEHVTATAVREVLEETGVEIRLDRPLRRQVYEISGGRSKSVHYWVGRVLGDPDVSGYAVNQEIDDVAWVGVQKARDLLTYADDVDLLEELLEAPKRTTPLVLLRHGRATKRGTWKGPEPDRPLTSVGRQQAQGLIDVLAAYGVTRLVSSDSKRCVQTVTPYAREQVVGLTTTAALNEADATEGTVASVVRHLLADKDCTALCSHRPVLPQVFAALGIEEEPLAPGEMVVCHHRKGRVLATERYLVR